MTVHVEHSATESQRFGVELGRCDVGESLDVDELIAAVDRFDVVVVRHPAGAVHLPHQLARMPGFTAWTADHLAIWEWSGPAAPAVDVAGPWSVGPAATRDEVVAVVRDAFADYRSHYRSNPLFPATAVLDGYVEWAVDLAHRQPDGPTTVRDGEGRAVGVALVDWEAAPPDIRLAGMRSAVQGRGVYGLLVSEVIAVALRKGNVGVRISTQSHNINVMRAWVRLGFVPRATVATVHLVRDALLGSATAH